MHAPASISEFKSSFLDKLFDLVFDLLVLPIIPHLEEFDFNISEFSGWISHQLWNNSGEDQVDLSLLVGLIGS